MKKIGLFVNEDKDRNLEYTRIIADRIIKRGGSIILDPRIASGLDLKVDPVVCDDRELFRMCDVVMTVGGDGTFLKAARKAYASGTPILGVNLGSLGFLTDVDRNEINEAVDLVLAGKYRIEERMMLESRLVRDGREIARDFALNDVVISRKALSRILHLRTCINGDFIDSFPGDGIIISSPTGSTAYSLSAGGPIVEPDMDIMIITPICPHILYSRSFITTGDREIEVTVDKNYGLSAMVTVDGQKGYEAQSGDTIHVRKASHKVRMVKIHSYSFFNILRSKIYNRGEDWRKDEI